MRIFLTGATGAIGKPLVPGLVRDGHTVIAATRRDNAFGELRAAGAEPVLCEVLNRDSVKAAVTLAKPDVVIHELTALAQVRSLRNFDKAFAETNRLRTEALDHLIVAAREVGASRFIAQSYAGWPGGRNGSRIKSEYDPLEPNPVRSMVQSLAAIRHVETTVPKLAPLTGIVLRYGSLYGPGTAFSPDGLMAQLLRRRALPRIGSGDGIWSFIHVEDAASATRLVVGRGSSGIYNIVDDDPAEVKQWLPLAAEACGAKPPLHIPEWLGLLAAGESVVSQMTEIRGHSNRKAKEELGWSPEHKSWRQGLPFALRSTP